MDTCIQFPPVDVTEKWVSSDLITASILKTHPLINLFGKQPITERLCLLTEIVWIDYHPCQYALFQLLAFNLKRRQTSLILILSFISQS